MSRLFEIRDAVRLRGEAIAAQHPEWPCRKGCDECCRRLAAVPRVSREEWRAIAVALDALPPEVAAAARVRIAESAGATRPVTCPLLDRETGSCLVYEARPVACRAYGFYSEPEQVLGCSRVEAMGRQLPGLIWGNHAALEDRLRGLGEAAILPEWQAREIP